MDSLGIQKTKEMLFAQVNMKGGNRIGVIGLNFRGFWSTKSIGAN